MQAAARAIAAALGADYDADPERWYAVAFAARGAYRRGDRELRAELPADACHEELEQAVALLDALGAVIPVERPEPGGDPAWLRQLKQRRREFVERHADRLPE
jgi:hypothetical protein